MNVALFPKLHDGGTFGAPDKHFRILVRRRDAYVVVAQDQEFIRDRTHTKPALFMNCSSFPRSKDNYFHYVQHHFS